MFRGQSRTHCLCFRAPTAISASFIRSGDTVSTVPMKRKARGLSVKVQLIAFLHDSAECYIGDLTRPLRRHIPEFTDYERALQKLIFEKYAAFEITDEERRAVREIDDSLLYHEFLTFHGAKLMESAPPLHIKLGSDKPHAETEAEFLEVYRRLHEAL